MENDNSVNSSLKILSRQFKNIEEVSEEIINLQAILNLPKGTELFLSDIHGEYGSFSNILNNGSGIIKSKIDNLFNNLITEKDKRALATLIYYPEEKLQIEKEKQSDIEEWYSITLFRLVEVAREVSSKYTRSKVRKALPKGFDYIIDELLHVQADEDDKENYYKQIIKSIIELKRADEFIVAISNLIKQMAIDHLHIVGDIFDRGSNAKLVMDTLMNYHSLDIQWGNHDILWMGAACGNLACISNVVRICSRYDNIDTLEDKYGINIRPLSIFAMETYKNDSCKKFVPKVYEYNKYLHSDEKILSKIHKAITIIQLKVEGNLIKEHPEYGLDDMLLLDKIDYEKGTVKIKGMEYKLNDTNFPTINPKLPYELTVEEKEVIERLRDSFLNSEILNKHVNLMYVKGGVYKIFNSNLLFHANIPMNENGDFREVNILGKKLKGKKYLDYVEEIANKAYFERKTNKEARDLMFYFWCSPNSPFFGKSKMATFERYFVDDKFVHREIEDPYFYLIEDEETCDKIFEEFEMDRKESHIINGHVPVKEKDGESPIKANGKLLVIDGGFAKSYRNQTGRAGYTLTYNSYGLILSANEPFDSKEEAIRDEIDIKYDIMVNEKVLKRKRVADTDKGRELQKEIAELKLLLKAYRDGVIKERDF